MPPNPVVAEMIHGTKEMILGTKEMILGTKEMKVVIRTAVAKPKDLTIGI